MLVEVARAEGSFFYTPDGKRYYDLVAGVSVSNVGHANPAVVRAVQEQAARYMHVMVYGELVETAAGGAMPRGSPSLLPAPLESVYFVNSGAEAVEGALKLAKRFTGRTEIDLHAPRLPRFDARRDEHDGRSRGRGVEGGVPAAAARRAAPIEFNDFDGARRASPAARPPYSSSQCRAKRACACRLRAGSKRCANAATARAHCSSSTKYRPDWAARASALRHAEIRRHARHRLPGQGLRRRACPSGRSSRVTKGDGRLAGTIPRWDISPLSAAIRSAVRRDSRRFELPGATTSVVEQGRSQGRVV